MIVFTPLSPLSGGGGGIGESSFTLGEFTSGVAHIF